jgi:hypothetical protein
MSKRFYYQLAPPPRSVPLFLRLHLLFGGFFNLFGWIFFGVGLIFFWPFGANADLSSAIYFRGDLEATVGKALFSEETGFSEGGSKGRSGTPVYANHYSFVYDGMEYTGISYATGTYFEGGEPVTIEYPKGRPSISRIEGMRRAMFGPWVLFVVIFPIIGIFFIFFGLKDGMKANRLLAIGRQGMGKLIAKVPTNTRINQQTVYKYTFEFTADDGRRHEVVARTHIPMVLEDEPQERLLYDPYNPSYAVMMDSLPASPAIDEAGNIVDISPLRLLPVIIAPGLTIIGHGTYLFFRYFI